MLFLSRDAVKFSNRVQAFFKLFIDLSSYIVSGFFFFFSGKNIKISLFFFYFRVLCAYFTMITVKPRHLFALLFSKFIPVQPKKKVHDNPRRKRTDDSCVTMSLRESIKFSILIQSFCFFYRNLYWSYALIYRCALVQTKSSRVVYLPSRISTYYVCVRRKRCSVSDIKNDECFKKKIPQNVCLTYGQ